MPTPGPATPTRVSTRNVIPRVFTLLATLAALVAVLVPATTVQAQPTGPEPPTNLVASDHPWDNGRTVDLQWDQSPDTSIAVHRYSIEQAPSADGPWTFVDAVAADLFKLEVKPVERDTVHYFRVVALTADGVRSTPAVSEGVVATMQIAFTTEG